MKKANLITIVLVFIFLSAFLFYILNYNSKITYGTKTSQSAVTIDITPLEFKNGKFYVDIKLNTHTVDLDNYDFHKAVILNYNNLIFNPEESLKLSGHHFSGTFIFNVNEKPKFFTIKVLGIPDIEERLFTW